MRKLSITILLAISFLNLVLAQNKTHFGFDFSVANDRYKIADTGDYLVSVPLVNALGGFNVRQELHSNTFVETGLVLKYYWQGFGFKTIPYYGGSSSDPSWIIPLRVGWNCNLYKTKVYLVPVLGYSLGINPPFGYGFGSGKQISGTTTITYSYTENSEGSRYFSLLQTGVGIEFKFFDTLLFSISANYYTGFAKTTQLDIQYTVNNTSQAKGTAISKGEFVCLSTGLKYPISKFWTTKN